MITTSYFRTYDWFSYSHWGMFRLAIITLPDWHAFAVVDEVDDDLLEEVEPPAGFEPATSDLEDRRSIR
jgi:hypothetical protein